MAATRRYTAGLLACLLLVVAGCTSKESGPLLPDDLYEPPYSWEQALEDATSDFEREVLADRQITAEEYAEAHQRWLACMEEIYPPETSGIAITLHLREDSLYEFITDVGGNPDNLPDDYDRNSDQCAIGTINVVATLYSLLLINPELLPIRVARVECYKRHGLVDDSYTVENSLADDLKDDPYATEVRPDGTEVRVPILEFDPSKVTDLDVHSEEVGACILNPSR